MAAARDGVRRDRPVPGRPRLGPRGPLRPRSRTRPARATPARAASSTTSPTSTPASSASARARRWRWTRSSGCCWKPPGRRSRTPGSTRLRCAAARPASSSGSMHHDYGIGGADSPESEGLPGRRRAPSVALRPRRLHARPRGPGGDRRHRLLLLAGRDAPGGAGAARRASATLALAGGVSVLGTPRRMFVEFSRAARPRRPTAAASPSPPAPTAPAGAEGVGMLAAGAALRRASATATRCWPWSRGSAVNQDGASNGLTAPNGPVAGAGHPRRRWPTPG